MIYFTKNDKKIKKYEKNFKKVVDSGQIVC